MTHPWWVPSPDSAPTWLRPVNGIVLNLSGLYLLRDCLLNDWTYWALLKGYRALSAANLVLGSSSAEELEGGVAMPKAYRKGMSSLQARRGL